MAVRWARQAAAAPSEPFRCTSLLLDPAAVQLSSSGMKQTELLGTGALCGDRRKAAWQRPVELRKIRISELDRVSGPVSSTGAALQASKPFRKLRASGTYRGVERWGTRAASWSHRRLPYEPQPPVPTWHVDLWVLDTRGGVEGAHRALQWERGVPLWAFVCWHWRVVICRRGRLSARPQLHKCAANQPSCGSAA